MDRSDPIEFPFILISDDGVVMTTKRGARQFVVHGRKDIAYAMMYAWIAYLTWLRMYDEDEIQSPEDQAGCSIF